MLQAILHSIFKFQQFGYHFSKRTLSGKQVLYLFRSRNK